MRCEMAAKITHRHQGFISHVPPNGTLKSPTLLHLKNVLVFEVDCGLQYRDLHWLFLNDIKMVYVWGPYTTCLIFLYVCLETIDYIPQPNRNIRVHRGPFY